MNVANFQTRQGDVIGWTNHGGVGPISLEFDEKYETYFREVGSDGYPKVEESYQFDRIHLPAIFSVAVRILNVQGDH